jgi:hypothetical protein
MRHSIALAVALALAPTARAANSNQTVNVQGVLRDATGALQSMAAGVDISLYNSQTATTPFYTQHFSTVPVDNGFFTVELAGSSLVFAAQPEAWIGITVDGDPSELPRQHLDAAPYAFSAGSADTISAACSGCITNVMLGGSIDGSKITGTVASATSATQLGGVAAANYQQAVNPAACPAGQVYSGIATDGTATCTANVSVPFSSITGWPANCTAGQYLVGYSGGTQVCAALNFTTAGGTNGSATTVARGDHTHPGVGTGWQKIYDQAYNANGTQTINVSPVNGTITLRILFSGSVTPFSGPSEIYLQRNDASGPTTTNYNSFIIGEQVGATGVVYNTVPVQPGFIMGRTTSASNSEMNFDYEFSELSGNLLGAIGHGMGATHVDGTAMATTMFRASGNNEYSTVTTSISIKFWNTSNVNGRFTVLQLM